MLVLVLSSMLSAPAQFYATSTLYDFESLHNGHLNRLDNWRKTPFNKGVD
ncbi:MAG: hypothetical protein RLZZ630_2065 [Bacteroidota bacterium]|jgi:hypothetical protein